MYLIDTDVVSELRHGRRVNPGVHAFMAGPAARAGQLFLSVITLGEIQQGIERLRRRGDERQAGALARWLEGLRPEFGESMLPIDEPVAELWGVLCSRDPHNPIDKLIAATALIHDLVVVTRNTRHFTGTGAETLNPFR